MPRYQTVYKIPYRPDSLLTKSAKPGPPAYYPASKTASHHATVLLQALLPNSSKFQLLASQNVCYSPLWTTQSPWDPATTVSFDPIGSGNALEDENHFINQITGETPAIGFQLVQEKLRTCFQGPALKWYNLLQKSTKRLVT